MVRRLIIDTDAGVDDAQAIMMALVHPGIEVVAITTSHGNTDITNVNRNVMRILNIVRKNKTVGVFYFYISRGLFRRQPSKLRIIIL